LAQPCAQASRARSARAPSSHLAMPGNANTASTYACAARHRRRGQDQADRCEARSNGAYMASAAEKAPKKSRPHREAARLSVHNSRHAGRLRDGLGSWPSAFVPRDPWDNARAGRGSPHAFRRNCPRVRARLRSEGHSPASAWISARNSRMAKLSQIGCRRPSLSRSGWAHDRRRVAQDLCLGLGTARRGIATSRKGYPLRRGRARV
jgi:hypothetical protein